MMEELVQSPTMAPPRPRPWMVFSSGSFRKLWVATALSLLGDFFSYIALAWLVLQLTGSSLALVMSLVMLASVGLTPVAYAASGAIAQINPPLLFLLAGGMILLCAAGTAASRTVRS